MAVVQGPQSTVPANEINTSRSTKHCACQRNQYFKVHKRCACHEICTPRPKLCACHILPSNLPFKVHKLRRPPWNLRASRSTKRCACHEINSRSTKRSAYHEMCNSRSTKYCSCHEICTSRFTWRSPAEAIRSKSKMPKTQLSLETSSDFPKVTTHCTGQHAKDHHHVAPKAPRLPLT